MRTISAKELRKQKRAGNEVKVGERPPKKPEEFVSPTVEQSLSTLNGYVKEIVTKVDHTKIITDSTERIAQTLSITLNKIEALQGQEKVQAWNISVQRGNDKLIKSIKMEAGT